MIFFKSSEHINKKGDGQYRGFGYLNLFSDSIDMEPMRIIVIRVVDTKTSINPKGTKDIKCWLEDQVQRTALEARDHSCCTFH